jgi:RNA polymerase sigma-70 factor (ECF subfamily)
LRRQEYNRAVETYAGNLYGYAIRFLRSEHDAQDIVQDVFEKLWLNRKKVEYLKVKSWMFTTAHNAMINFLNRKDRMQYGDAVNTRHDENEQSNRYEAREIVDKAVSFLPPVQKSVVLLRDLEGYTYQEIGEILEISEAQVKVYLFRARKKLKNQLQELMELA